MAAHFELHIEPGPISEASGKKIGVVEGVQAFRWHVLTVYGRDSHTGQPISRTGQMQCLLLRNLYFIATTWQLS